MSREPAVRLDGTSPCWEVLRDGAPYDEEFNPHFDTHLEAETYLEDLRQELVDDVAAGAAVPALTIDLAGPTPCWIAVCAGCGEKLENYDTGGVIHHPSPDDALNDLEVQDWHRGPEGTWRCTSCGPDPDWQAEEDRRPGPGQLAVDGLVL